MQPISTLRIMSKHYQPTPEQIALSEERKAKRRMKLAAMPTATPTADDTKGRILERKWIELPVPQNVDATRRIKFMTWNVSGKYQLLKLQALISSVFIAAGPNSHQ